MQSGKTEQSFEKPWGDFHSKAPLLVMISNYSLKKKSLLYSTVIHKHKKLTKIWMSLFGFSLNLGWRTREKDCEFFLSKNALCLNLLKAFEQRSPQGFSNNYLASV